MKHQTLVMGRNNEMYEANNGLLGKHGLIKVEAEDRVVLSNVRKSRYRMLYSFEEYGIIDVENVVGEKISVFCLKSRYNNVVKECKKLVESSDVVTWNVMYDWIAFPSVMKEDVINEFKDDYENWWVRIPEDEREEIFWDSCK